MSGVASSNEKKSLSASELRKKTHSERDALLKEQATLAEHTYRTDRALTDFEAFGEEDLHGNSSSANAG